jgi:hypothetical protein
MLYDFRNACFLSDGRKIPLQDVDGHEQPIYFGKLLVLLDKYHENVEV